MMILKSFGTYVTAMKNQKGLGTQTKVVKTLKKLRIKEQRNSGEPVKKLRT